jgi:hypothetical protein
MANKLELIEHTVIEVETRKRGALLYEFGLHWARPPMI